jgi:hypothetical protein
MTSLQKTSQSSFIRQGRARKKRSQQPARWAPHASSKSSNTRSVNLPRKLVPAARRVTQPAHRSSASRAGMKSPRNSYDLAFTLGHTRIHAPVLQIPQLGTRWVSAALTVFLVFLLFTLWTSSPFQVASAQVIGNQRLSSVEINSMLGIIGQPVFKAVPALLEANLHTAFSDLKSIKVHVGFPNHVKVVVVERTPVLAWYQDGVVTWIDADGVAFTPRGEVANLIMVAAIGAPGSPMEDPSLPLYEQRFITPQMVQALTGLARDVPPGMPLIYDPQYGMGWLDPGGWTVYFGQEWTDVQAKKMVYQAIINTLTQQGVQPTLISVAYLDAPFYK